MDAYVWTVIYKPYSWNDALVSLHMVGKNIVQVLERARVLARKKGHRTPEFVSVVREESVLV